ncbi:hypothetical protein OE059_04745 [Exiguobacterium profundum]|uniref:MotA/TolQ/ExbB proton channel family protein n=1 Tax=Exiguobacterium profundum TaxID=307643 RepID=A0ABY8B226_9BACL|nr:hypothetical protein [Exiguobacterium profundum]WED56171.1 hypothetical protein OE059_04745 [Exiguobacterium profundum]
MKKLFSFKVFPSFLIFILFLFLPLKLTSIENYNDVIGFSIGIGGSSLGFFVAAVTLLQSGSISTFMKRTKELGTDVKIIRWLMTSILYSFLFSFSGLFLLMFHELNQILDRILFSFWVASLTGVVIAGGMTVFSLFVMFIIEDK